MNHDTAAFAVNAIRRWSQEIDRTRNPDAIYLTVTADSGRGNGSRMKLWKRELHVLANERGKEGLIGIFFLTAVLVLCLIT